MRFYVTDFLEPLRINCQGVSCTLRSRTRSRSFIGSTAWDPALLVALAVAGRLFQPPPPETGPLAPIDLRGRHRGSCGWDVPTEEIDQIGYCSVSHTISRHFFG